MFQALTYMVGKRIQRIVQNRYKRGRYEHIFRRPPLLLGICTVYCIPMLWSTWRGSSREGCGFLVLIAGEGRSEGGRKTGFICFWNHELLRVVKYKLQDFQPPESKPLKDFLDLFEPA